MKKDETAKHNDCNSANELHDRLLKLDINGNIDHFPVVSMYDGSIRNPDDHERSPDLIMKESSRRDKFLTLPNALSSLSVRESTSLTSTFKPTSHQNNSQPVEYDDINIDSISKSLASVKLSGCAKKSKKTKKNPNLSSTSMIRLYVFLGFKRQVYEIEGGEANRILPSLEFSNQRWRSRRMRRSIRAYTSNRRNKSFSDFARDNMIRLRHNSSSPLNAPCPLENKTNDKIELFGPNVSDFQTSEESDNSV